VLGVAVLGVAALGVAVLGVVLGAWPGRACNGAELQAAAAAIEVSARAAAVVR
jgi:hypothetical protein